MVWLTWISTYAIIILVELGDKTQLATLLLASNNAQKKWTIFAAGATALPLAALINVTVGTSISQHFPPSAINKATGVLFLTVGLVMLTRELVLPWLQSRTKIVGERVAEPSKCPTQEGS